MKVKNKAETPQAPSVDPARSWREAIESIVIAVVLAFLFRAFEAEAFVIPTGSMAPTLQGRHKDVECSQCGFQYQAGASVDSEVQKGPVEATRCPMCLFTEEMNPRNPDHYSHTGDRILVNKFAYEAPFGEPKRWDVIVFKYPGNAKQNYIKRLIGLENETIRLFHGDVFVAPAAPDANAPQSFQIARKPPDKLETMLQLVHDTKYLAKTLQDVKWPLHWRPYGNQSTWKSPDAGATYECTATEQTAWLHYGHQYLNFDIWDQILGQQQAGRTLESAQPKVVPITDFYAYNAQSQRASTRSQAFDHPESLGMHWVGDLALEAEIEVVSDAGQVTLDLIEAGRHHTCSLDIATGNATLRIDGGQVPFVDDKGQAAATELHAKTELRGAGSYHLRFANVDNQLVLWVDGDVVAFDHPTTYGPTPDDRPRTSSQDPGDLHPLRVGVQQADVKLTRLRVLRDIYYIATDDQIGSPIDYPQRYGESQIISHLHSPEHWRAGDIFDQRKTVEFAMAKDQFFPLGDNSPYSRDGRMWGAEHYVERDLLIGKAVLIYWPHPWRVRIPGTAVTLPAIPNFRRFALIH
jgi:signal peptidase I